MTIRHRPPPTKFGPAAPTMQAKVAPTRPGVFAPPPTRFGAVVPAVVQRAPCCPGHPVRVVQRMEEGEKTALKERVENELMVDEEMIVDYCQGPFSKVGFGHDRKQLALAIQEHGTDYGCYSCPEEFADTGRAMFHADHIPPTNLKKSVFEAIRKIHKIDVQRLYPQCSTCSNQQATLVLAINNGIKDPDALTQGELNLITPGRGGKYVDLSYVGQVPDYDTRQLVYAYGNKKSCHSCGNKPQVKFVADHFPPQEFVTSYAKQVLEYLDVSLPEMSAFVPQCSVCSSEQGGRIRGLSEALMETARILGIKVYK